MSTLRQDVGYGLRTMRRAPGFTATILVTLGLGIGVNATTFSIVDVLLWKPLHYRDPGRVAFVLGWDTARQQMRFNLPLVDALDLGRGVGSFERVSAYQYWSANLTGADAPERLQAYRVTSDTFDLLGTPALIGRPLQEGDGDPHAPDVVVLSYGLWQRRFAADPGVVGRLINLDGRSYDVIGVMPPRFEFPIFNFKGDAWSPLRVDPADLVHGRSPSVVAIARLKRGSTYAQARAEATAVMSRLAVDHPETNRGLGAHVVEMRRLPEEQVGPLGPVLLGAVGFVLLLACANVANLLLSRAVARERELAVRAALGAGRRRLARQLLTESLVLGLGGAGLGLALAFWALRAIVAWLPDAIVATMPNVLDLGVDGATLGFTALVAVGSVLLFGTAPALKAAHEGLAANLQTGTRAAGGHRHRRLRSALLVTEVAMALVLLVAAGLLVRTFDRLRRVDPGFDADSVLTLTVSLPDYRYGDVGAQRAFFEQTAEGVAGVPGVVSAAWVNVLPFSTYDRGTHYLVEGRDSEPGQEASAAYRVVTPDYFGTLRIPLVAGRAFDRRDRETSPGVAIVNRVLALREFGSEAAVGRRLRFGRVGSKSAFLTIVGVVGNLLHSEIAAQPEAEIYVPFAQAPDATMMLAVRTAGDPREARGPLTQAIAAVDPSQPVYHVKTLRELVDAALLPNATVMSMMATFGALAILLAAVGIYGVVSYFVSQQRREIGVRLALGATPGGVLRLVLRRGLSLVLGGALIGCAAAAGITRLMRGILFGITPTDAPTYVGVVGLLVGIGTIACYVPARRAMRLDPVDVLRAE